MAIPKKGTRPITVRGVRYLWRVRKKPTYSQANAWSGINVAIQRAEGGGGVLLVEGADVHPGNWMQRPFAPITPGRVEAWIEAALVRGWDPLRSGAPFVLRADRGSPDG